MKNRFSLFCVAAILILTMSAAGQSPVVVPGNPPPPIRHAHERLDDGYVEDQVQHPGELGREPLPLLVSLGREKRAPLRPKGCEAKREHSDRRLLHTLEIPHGGQMYFKKANGGNP
jgi:hypothetical protein